MSFSFSSLIRLIVLLALTATMLAVGLARLDPVRPERRTRCMTRFSNINEYFLDVADRIPRWLDSEDGKIGSHPPEDGDVLEAASCAPWVDEKGHGQVAGRWSSRTRNGSMSVSSDFGLARYTFPGSEMLDHVSTEIVPVGAPCWYPGTRARILFAAGDGKLYHFAFEPEPSLKAIDPEAKRDTVPKPLGWRCKMPGEGNIFISDLNWPEDPRMAGGIVAALREQETSPAGLKSYSRTQLWWLKVNFAGTEVVEAVRLLHEDDSRNSLDSIDLRCPSVGTLADGRLALAYLSQCFGTAGWDLKVTPIELVGDQQTPKAVSSSSIVVSSKCQPSQPMFSPDGRWLNCLTGEEMKKSRVGRISTVGLFKSAG